MSVEQGNNFYIAL